MRPGLFEMKNLEPYIYIYVNSYVYTFVVILIYLYVVMCMCTDFLGDHAHIEEGALGVVLMRTCS